MTPRLLVQLQPSPSRYPGQAPRQRLLRDQNGADRAESHTNLFSEGLQFIGKHPLSKQTPPALSTLSCD